MYTKITKFFICVLTTLATSTCQKTDQTEAIKKEITEIYSKLEQERELRDALQTKLNEERQTRETLSEEMVALKAELKNFMHETESKRKDENPKLSEIFKTQLLQYLKDGGKLSTQASGGTNVLTLKSQLTDAKATFDLLISTWPPDFCPEARENFKKSHQSYELALRLWSLKLKDGDEPCEPDVNGWLSYHSLAGVNLVVKTHPNDYIVPGYRGKKYLPFDENISVFLTLGGAHFEKGRSITLKDLD